MIDEKKIIDILTKVLSLEHDDVSFIKLGNKFLVLKCDMLVRKTDAPKNMRLWQIARKSIVASMSDMVCKGVKPIATLISLAIPREFTRREINELAKGFKVAEKEFDIKIIGGDTNEGEDLIIDVVMAGISDKIVRRDNAQIGDLIISTGLFGYTGAGLRILMNNADAEPRFRRVAINSILLPKPRTEFLNIVGYVNSSMDSSDGLAATLNELSDSSKKCFIIDKIPSSDDVKRFAIVNGYNAEELIFDSGEEYEIIATLPKENLDYVMSSMNVKVIGRVEEGKGVYIMNKKIRRLRRKGFIHLLE
ncbi:MAG: thiamine-phosphate kinase [Candidatus Nitrosocaldaceae archaeon]